MSSNQFHHGLSNRDHVDSQGFIRETPTNVIGLVAFADDADEQFYPLNTPVLITNINTGLAKSGYHGNLRKSLETIQAIVNPTIVVVRIPSPFVDGGFNASRVIGTTQADGKRTGLQALLTAKTRLGVVPKINIVPDCETPDVINALININKKLRAFSYVTPRDKNAQMLATKEQVVAYRKTLGDKEVMLIWPEFTAGNVLQSDYASTISDEQPKPTTPPTTAPSASPTVFQAIADGDVVDEFTLEQLKERGYFSYDRTVISWDENQQKFRVIVSV